MLVIQLAEASSTSEISFKKSYDRKFANKKKITTLPKKEAGGDEKHVYFFTQPY